MKPSFNQALNHRIIGLTNQAEPNFITVYGVNKKPK
jgi:hypothetical protein